MRQLSKMFFLLFCGLLVMASCNSKMDGAGKTDSLNPDSMNSSMATDTSRMLADSLNITPPDTTVDHNEAETKDAPRPPQ